MKFHPSETHLFTRPFIGGYPCKHSIYNYSYNAAHLVRCQLQWLISQGVLRRLGLSWIYAPPEVGFRRKFCCLGWGLGFCGASWKISTQKKYDPLPRRINMFPWFPLTKGLFSTGITSSNHWLSRAMMIFWGKPHPGNSNPPDVLGTIRPGNVKLGSLLVSGKGKYIP